MSLNPKLESALAKAREALAGTRTAEGFWEGEPSSSAVSTAAAVTALAMVARERPRSEISSFKTQIASGLNWLASHVNADGAWGDTPASPSNLTATALAWAAFGAVPEADSKFSAIVQGAERWLKSQIGEELSGKALQEALVNRDGKDRLVATAILVTCAAGGRLGPDETAWSQVPQLPFERAISPLTWFFGKRSPENYATPALFSLGLASHINNPKGRSRLGNWAEPKAFNILEDLQPWGGGLAAVTMASFVIISLAACGHVENNAAKQALHFLLELQRKDGSWANEANRSVPVTCLALNALTLTGVEAPENAAQSWLLGLQCKAPIAHTTARVGGWARTNLPGCLPDAESTALVLQTLKRLQPWVAVPRCEALFDAVGAAICWLTAAQNSDGGVATFHSGWGDSPVGCSAPELTAQALQAWTAWKPEMPSQRQKIDSAIQRALGYLRKVQRPDGSWAALWCGNESAPDRQNLTCGTSRVVLALAELEGNPAAAELQKGVAWLIGAQNKEGGWGAHAGGSASVEETAWALESLAGVWKVNPNDEVRKALTRGRDWLLARMESETWNTAAPVGIHYGRFGFSERLYPQIHMVTALAEVARCEKLG